jgi:ABC-type glycerol-3-phosphate transport system substrate-binding protein
VAPERRHPVRVGHRALLDRGADGWTLTDLFENIYLRTAGPDKYDQLATHEIPWTDQSVKDALTTMADVLKSDQIAGGTEGALQTDFPTSVTNVFSDSPKAAQVMEGDFVAGVITDSTKAEPGTGFDVFPFPSINGSPQVVVGGGDTVVMFKDSPAAEALVKYLASPEAAQIWAEEGRVRHAEQEHGHERVPGRHHQDDRGRALPSGDVPLRPVRPPARRVRRHRRARVSSSCSRTS